MGKTNKITIVTLGCSKNLVDSENLLGKMKSLNFEICHDIKKSDVLLINTCGFIKAAKEESIGIILEACELKRQKKLKKIIVFGCLAERYKEELSSQLVDVDYVFGLNQEIDIINSLTKKVNSNIIGTREILTPAHYAYLKISEGCNHQCSFCAIPFIRGKYISKSIEEIVSEAKDLINKGVKELILIAQDTTYYGTDLYGKTKIAQLLEECASIDGLEWLRLMYTYPSNFPYEILDVMNNHHNICKSLDIPLQHISDKILKSMKRGTDRKKTEDLIHRIREKVPDISIRSTFIVGYPEETEKDFKELHEFIKSAKLDRVGVFTYSHEDDTPAFVLNDKIPEKIKLERQKILMETQAEISLEKNKKLIGQKIKVLIDEKKSKNKYTGRTEHDAPDVDNSVIVNSKSHIKAGDFVFAEVYKAKEYDIFANLSTSKI